MNKLKNALDKLVDKDKKDELTVLGRRFIGKEIGINDIKSPIIQNNQVFNDRVSLLEPFVYIRDIIETYIEESKSFETEEEYQIFIEKSEREIYKYIEDELDIAVSIDEALGAEWFRPKHLFKTDLLTKDFIDAKMVEISLGGDILYEAFKYKTFHSPKQDTLKEFLKEHCKCKYLQHKCKLELDKFDEYHKAILKLALDEISHIMMSKTSSVMNTKQLMHVGGGSIVYSIQPDVRIGTLESIYKSLETETLDRNIIDVNTYTLQKPCEQSDMLLKKYDNGTIVPVKYTEPEMLSLMRYLDNSKMKNTDRICEINGTYYKLNKQLNLDWNLN